MLAVELRDGIPWFIFDAGSGPGVVKPDGDTKFNDGLWHTLTAMQDGSTGSIIVDDVHNGSTSSVGASVVVGYVEHYVGGIPSTAARQTLNGNLNPLAILSGDAFAGCLFDVVFNGRSFNFSASEFPGVGSSGLGCPVDLTPSVQFLSGGYLALDENIISGNSFNLSFRFRTTHSSGLLFFLHDGNNASLGLEIRNSNLYLVHSRTIDMISSAIEQPCNGEWQSVVIEQEGDQLIYSINEIVDVLTLSSDSPFVFPSQIFFGGVPQDSVSLELAQEAGFDVYTPFSGCIEMSEPLLYIADQPVSGHLATAESELVSFEGCGNLPGSSCVAPWREIEAGLRANITVSELTPFSGIIYIAQCLCVPPLHNYDVV